jgi:hypothetical protein
MGRIIKLFVVVMLSTVAYAQQTPTAYGAFLGAGSPVTWSPWTSAAAFGGLGFTPPAIGLYCQASAGAAWTPCNPSGGGGGGATFTPTGIQYATSTTAASVVTPTQMFAAFSTQAANCLFAGPASGSAATPTCRAQVPADLPVIFPNSVLMNSTGSSAQTQQFTMPTCNTSPVQALQYAPGTGIICVNIPAGTTSNALTMNNSGSGAASGTTFNGSASQTISYNTIGAQQALTLTTTGSSGAATLSAGSLNIPQYAGGGGTSNPSTCTVNSANDICIGVAPYYASTAGLTTTTVTGTFAVGTSGTIASCSTFLANQGVYIAGAGVSAANYIGTIVSCTGTTLTVTPATSTAVSSSNVVQHDESATIQAAITALASTGGNIWFPDGTYLVNGPLQDTGGANAILDLPSIVYGNNTPLPIEIAFRGLKQPTQIGVPEGSVIQTALPTGNLIGGYQSGGPFPNFTNVYLTLDSITLRGYSNPGFVAVSAFNVAGLRMNHVWIDAGTLPNVTPTTSSSTGVQAPSQNNSAFVQLNDVGVFGYYTGFVLGEHTIAVSIYGASDRNGFVLDSALGGSAQTVNSISIDYAWCQQCTYEVVAAGPLATTVNIQNLDIEAPVTAGIFDPGNLLRGVISYHVPYAGGAVTPTNPAVTGAANVTLVNLDHPEVNTFEAEVVNTGVVNTGVLNAGTPIGTPGWNIGSYAASGPSNIGAQSGSGTWAFLTTNSSGSPGFIWDSSHTLTLATSTANTGAGFNPLVTLTPAGLLTAPNINDSGLGSAMTKSVSGLLTAAVAGTDFVAPPVSNAITSATGGSGTGTVTCATASCTNLRGSYTVAGGTFATGTLLALVWPTTTTAYVCSASVLNNATGASIGYHSIATATGMNITSLTAVTGLSVDIDYSCQP